MPHLLWSRFAAASVVAASVCQLSCADDAPSAATDEPDPFDGSNTLERALGASCANGDVCTETGDPSLYPATYRIGSTPTSRGELQQTFKGRDATLPTAVTLVVRHLRAFTSPSTAPAPRLHVGLYALGGARPEQVSEYTYFAEGSVPLCSFRADGTTVPAAFGPGGLVTVPLTSSIRFVPGATYGAVIWTDDLPAAGTGTLLVGVGALVSSTFAEGAAYRRSLRREAGGAWGASRFRRAGDWPVFLDFAASSNHAPIWSTASALGGVDEDALVSRTLVADDEDLDVLTYTSANLPAWLSLDGATGVLSGTAPFVKTNTETTFTVTVADPLGANASRTFSLFVVNTGPEDVTPDVFTFSPATNLTPSTITTSAIVPITGIDDDVPVAISGGAFRVCPDASCVSNPAFRTTGTTLSNGAYLQLQATSAPAYGTDVHATITVGSASATFTASTRAMDATPDAFAFTAVTNARPSTTQNSNIVAITGIDPGVAISIASGTYRICSDASCTTASAYTASAGTVNPGSYVQLQVTSAAGVVARVTPTLTLGTAAVIWPVTTTVVFTDQTGIATNASVTSNTVVLGTGFTGPLTATCGAGCTGISRNGGALTAGPVAGFMPGDTLALRQTASSSSLTTTTAIVSLGGTPSLPWSVTTLAGPSYLPVGPQLDVAVSTVTSGGWSLCHSSTFASSTAVMTDILAACSQGRLMIACRTTNAGTLTLLAQAPRANVLFDAGSSNNMSTANGSSWYFSAAWSWGFVNEGDTVVRNNCDTSTVNGQYRMCWHTGGGTSGLNIAAGYRCGSNRALNASTAFERLVFQAN